MGGPFYAKITLKKGKGADDALAERVDQARQLIAKTLVEAVAEFVKDEIPRRGGWYDIYREAVLYFSANNNLKWAASGLWPKTDADFPADSTLIEFEAGTETNEVTGEPNKVTAALVSYNPWTVDRLPSLSGGIQAGAKAQPASSAEVAAQRERLLEAEDAIKAALQAAGAAVSINPNEPSKIRGKVYADVGFMALALEHGLAGLPRLPHWVKALRRVQNDAAAWVTPVRSQVQEILSGRQTFTDKAQEMPTALETKIGL